MRTTKTIFDQTARKAIFMGVNLIYESVKRTFGPNGRNALLYRTFGRISRITNDGYTVAEVQEPKNIFVRLAANTFKETCKKTNEKVGDGTSGTVIIAGRLYNKIYSVLSESAGINSKGQNPIEIRKKILETSEKIKNQILKQSKKIKTIDELENIAAISIEDKEIGKIIAKMAWEIGVDGFIDVVDGHKGKIETDIIKGMRFAAKVPAKGFLNNAQKFEMVATDCSVLVTNYDFNNTEIANKILGSILDKKKKVIIIAPHFSEQVLQLLYLTKFRIDNKGNRIPTGLELFPVEAPSLRTDQFEDLAIYCGARFIDKAKGTKLENTQQKDFGFIGKLVVKDVEVREDAIALDGGGTFKTKIDLEEETGIKEREEKKEKTPIEERIEILKGQLKEQKDKNFKKLLERRIASINSAVGVIRVGGSTEANSLYKKLKIEDGVYACKAALRGGYVKGGGLCLKEIADKLSDEDIVKEAILEPYNIIQSSGVVKIIDNIIDPTEAIYYSVEYAMEVVANLATVEVITAEYEPPMAEEGNLEIAKSLKEYIRIQKIKEGLMKENEDEMWKDALGGLTMDEHLSLDN